QWQESQDGGSTWNSLGNTSLYANVKTTTMNLTSAPNSMNTYQNRCVVSGTVPPAVTSSAATLNFNTVPSISVGPSSSTICPNNNTSFSVTASGTNVTYQWQESQNNGSTWSSLTNTGVYSNVTTTAMNLTAAPNTMNTYQYRCVVSGTCNPAVTSSAATLNFNTVPSISVGPSSSTICPNGNTSFSVTASGTGISYQWQENQK